MRARVGTLALMVTLSALVATPLSAASPSPAPFALPPTDCPAGVPLAPGSIATIAGGGNAPGDGGQAIDARIDVTAGGLAVDASGAVYFASGGPDGVRRVGTDGVLSTLAGPPMRGPTGIDVAPDGSLVVADAEAGRIWRIATDGGVSTVAGPGTGDAGSGDGGPATAATVHPSHVRVGADGSIYLDDVPRYRVITPDGIIHPFAGTATPGFAGDGGPAIAALLGGADPNDRSYPDVEGSVVAPDGSVYLTDNANSRIRKVDPAGTITTVAGTGQRGYSGDGGPALEATFQDPVDLALDDSGDLFVSEHHNDVVRKIDTNGTISTVAGGGNQPGASGECGPATEASFQPWAIAVRGGYLYIGDMANQRIRVVKL